MELTDTIFTTLYIFAILMVVVLLGSYISFKIRKKRDGDLEPYQKNIEVKEASVPKIKIKPSTNKRTSAAKTSVSRSLESTSLDSARKKEKDKAYQRAKAEERERQRSKEKLIEARKKEKERAEKLAKERSQIEKTKVKREDRIQVLNSLTSNSSTDEPFENKIYNRPSTPFRRSTNTNSGSSFSNSNQTNPNNSIFENYTDNEDTNFYSPKISSNKGNKEKD